jgi:hypothetical protein
MEPEEPLVPDWLPDDPADPAASPESLLPEGLPAEPEDPDEPLLPD